MHWNFGKVNLKGAMLQNLISFYLFFDQELSLEIKNHFA
jgi:hypothetical protein